MSPIRWLLAAPLVALAALAACGGGGTSTGGGAACAAAVRWHGEWLLGTSPDARVRRRLPPLRGTVRTTRPPCNDANGPRETRSTPVVLHRLAGVAPAIALAEAKGGRVETVYLGQGFPVELVAHPLHRPFFGSDARPLASRGRCRPVVARTGRIAASAVGGGAIAVGGRTWTLDAQTKADVPAVGGMPRLASGLRVRVEGVRCGARWVARRITAA